MNKKEQFIHIDDDGKKRYFSDRKMTIYHREDGPAIEWACGGKWWYLNGKCHREDGPAIECASGRKSWYLNGKLLTEEEFNARMKPIELTLDEIAEKFGVSVEQLKIKK
jgi:hypothetical protein